ncbi:MAG: selenocysteine-specific translation elongation factor [Verrucomicrobiia bacterium]
MSTLRKNIMLGTAGHVDHGKSALVKLLTGCETDTLDEEKQRGLTIDLGFAPCRLADARVVGVVDVPGHIDFIRNMVAGAHGVDVAILVVAADDGIMPQTREHLHILSLMGLRRGVAVLTKVDLVDAARRESVTDELRTLFQGTFLENAPICPLSNVTGEGFESFFNALNETVDACADRTTSGIFRVWVDDAFTIRGSGTVVTGIPVRGTVRPEDRLVLLPGSLAGRVRRMQVYGEDATSGRAGECVALNIPELDYLNVRRGMVLTEFAAAPPVSMAEAELQALPTLLGAIKDYLEVQLHIGTAAVAARVAMLEFGEMTAGEKQMVQLRLAEPLPIFPGDRFVIRTNVAHGQSGLTTVGGGVVLGISNTRLRRRKPWVLDSLSARRAAIHDLPAWCELMVREAPDAISSKALASKCGFRLEELPPFVDPLIAKGRLLRTTSGLLVHSQAVSAAAASLLGAVREFHTANPQRAGLEREELAGKVAIPLEIFEMAVARLVLKKELSAQGTLLAQSGWTARLADPEQRLREDIATAYQAAGFTPPGIPELAQTLRAPTDRVERMVKLLVDQRVLVRLDERILMHQSAIESAKQTALRLFRKGPVFSTMEFRDALGVSRKFAVPLLDHLDKLRFTVRSGHDRTPGTEAKPLLKGD